MLTLAIRGLAAIAYKGGNPPKYEILLDPAHHHIATLSAFTEFLDPEHVANPWLPDAFGYMPIFKNDGTIEFKQIAVWNLVGKRIAFTGGIGNLKKWNNRHEAIDFNTLHPDSTVVNSSAGFSVIEIAQGQPFSDRPFPFTLSGPNGDDDVQRATEIRWSDLPMDIEYNGLGIKFQTDSSNRDPFAMVANIAPEPDPEKAQLHFDHYYEDILRDKNGKKIDKTQRYKLIFGTAETYDCVPPGATPPLP
jgi:hypothetical protein